MIPRTVPESGSMPYYFTWRALREDGTSIAQYDERGQAWLLAETREEAFEGIVAVEIFIHPAYVTGSPTLRMPVEGRFAVEYQARQALTVGGEFLQTKYLKQQIWVRCERTGLTVVGTPEDFDSTGQVPSSSWAWEIQLAR